MLTIKEMLQQKKVEAQLQAQKNEQKSKNVIKCGANLASQWGKVVNNEQRLIDNGHFMKTDEMAKIDYARENRRQKRISAGKVEKIVLIKR